MTKLEAEQKEKFANLLKQYPNLFAHNDNDSGHTTVVKHKIPLKDETPFKDRRIPPGVIYGGHCILRLSAIYSYAVDIFDRCTAPYLLCIFGMRE